MLPEEGQDTPPCILGGCLMEAAAHDPHHHLQEHRHLLMIVQE
jgi:hypothetical protein